jgi:hypothetical protein
LTAFAVWPQTTLSSLLGVNEVKPGLVAPCSPWPLPIPKLVQAHRHS